MHGRGCTGEKESGTYQAGENVGARFSARPFIGGHFSQRLDPALLPRHVVGQHRCRIGTASHSKVGPEGAPRGRSCLLVPKVHAPSDTAGLVKGGTVGGQFVHEKQVALLHGQRNHSFLVWQMRFADAETLAPVYPVARVDVRDDMQAAVLKRRVGEGQPYGEDERRISLFKMDLGILMPGGPHSR